MSTSRVSLAVVSVLALVAVVAPSSHAWAGTRAPSVSIVAACDGTTGDYLLSFDLANPAAEAASVEVLTYEVDGSASTAPVFAPDPVPANGTAGASDSAQGTTTSVAIEVQLGYADTKVAVDNSLTLDGTCEVDTTTSTTHAPDIPAVCAFLEELHNLQLDDLESEAPDALLAQLQEAIDAFERAAAVAPAEVAGDVQDVADGLSEIHAIVTEIAAQQGQPTTQQQQQLDAIAQGLQSSIRAIDTWATANCAANEAVAVRATPTYTG